MSNKAIYLCSQSPRRYQLLMQVGYEPRVIPKQMKLSDYTVDEQTILNEKPDAYVIRLANAKAKMGWRYVQEQQLSIFPVIGADTIITIDGMIIGKPHSLAHAEQILQRISGRTHQVMSAVCVVAEQFCSHRLNISHVRFGKINTQQLSDYLQTQESMDKAGAYAIQGYAAKFIQHIEGSYSGIMGLPLYELNQILSNLEQ